MNSKRLKEIEGWIIRALNGPPDRKFLVITGPTGCGKTFTVKTLLEIHEVPFREIYSHTEIVAASRNYNSLSFEKLEAGSRVYLIDNLCSQLFASDYVKSWERIDIPTIMIVTDPVRDEPHFSIWLHDILSSGQAHHVEYNDVNRI